MRRATRTRLLLACLGAHAVLVLTGVGTLTATAGEPTVRARPGPAPPVVSSAPAPSPSAPQPGPAACEVTFVPRDRWQTGFTADLVVTNYGPRVDSWELRYRPGDGVRLVTGWNGVWLQQGEEMQVRNARWNGTLATGASATAGLSAAVRGAAPPPTDFSLNGVACR